MRTDFADFLRTSSNTSTPTEDGEPTPIFEATGRPVSEPEIVATEARLGVRLPKSYRYFLQTLGTGDWCGDTIPPLESLFAIDSRSWGLDGFVVLVDNVLGVGDRIAINPLDPVVEGERPVYYCSHDPFGHAQVAGSFEEWCRATSEAAVNRTSYYERFSEDIRQSWRSYKRAHRWWRFW